MQLLQKSFAKRPSLVACLPIRQCPVMTPIVVPICNLLREIKFLERFRSSFGQICFVARHVDPLVHLRFALSTASSLSLSLRVAIGIPKVPLSGKMGIVVPSFWRVHRPYNSLECLYAPAPNTGEY